MQNTSLHTTCVTEEQMPAGLLTVFISPTSVILKKKREFYNHNLLLVSESGNRMLYAIQCSVDADCCTKTIRVLNSIVNLYYKTWYARLSCIVFNKIVYNVCINIDMIFCLKIQFFVRINRWLSTVTKQSIRLVF